MNTLLMVMRFLFFSASILGVLDLSVDRFLAVYLHLRYQEIVTPKRVVSILILSWPGDKYKCFLFLDRARIP